MTEITFDPNRPFGRTFHGEGKPRKSDAVCAFFQDGLYFDGNGKLVKNDHNDRVLESRKPVTKAALASKVAEPVPDLTGESDDAIFRMALTLYNKLARQGDTPDYEPSVEAREENMRFLASRS